MKTGSLRTRVILTTLALLAIVLAVVVAATTLAYRAKLDGDLRNQLTNAGVAAKQAGAKRKGATDARPRPRPPRAVPGFAGLSQLASVLALEGIAIRIVRSPRTASEPPTIHANGSLLTLDEGLPNGTHVVLRTSSASVDRAVTNLLLVELVVAAAALGLAGLLVVRGTRTALRPLSAVIETATRITDGDTTLRLKPSRTDTELGRLAFAFDQMLDALQAAIEEAQASDSATRRFLADASHELRTPIAALQASVETLLREQPERPERDRLEASVARASERVGRLVDDLLGLARLEARPNRVPVDLAAIARPILEEARARQPNATITLTAVDDAVVRGDPDALERLLRNLVDNALAAIEPNGRVDLQFERHDGHLSARVTDDGLGVPDSQRERIFERFARLDPSKPGHGLGLAIARRIADQHQGELSCDSVPEGASFTLRLPTKDTTAFESH